MGRWQSLTARLGLRKTRKNQQETEREQSGVGSQDSMVSRKPGRGCFQEKRGHHARRATGLTGGWPGIEQLALDSRADEEERSPDNIGVLRERNATVFKGQWGPKGF